MARGASGSAGAAGGDVVHSRAFEVALTGGIRRAWPPYAIIGILAFKLAIGAGGKLTNQQGALHTVAHQPFGHVLLTLVAIGLGGYALWRFVRAASGHGPEGSDNGFDRVAAGGQRGRLRRAVLRRGRDPDGVGGAAAPGTPQARRPAGVLGWPGGTWIVGIAGAVMIGVGALPGLPRGDAVVPRGFEDRGDEPRGEELDRPGRDVGHLARMVVFGLVGVFLVKAAVDYNPRAAVGLDGALAKIVHRSYGSYLLGIVAAGLVAFALYSLSDARYRRI